MWPAHLAAAAGGKHGDGRHKACHTPGALVQHVHAQAVLHAGHLHTADRRGIFQLQALLPGGNASAHHHATSDKCRLLGYAVKKAVQYAST